MDDDRRMARCGRARSHRTRAPTGFRTVLLELVNARLNGAGITATTRLLAR